MAGGERSFEVIVLGIVGTILILVEGVVVLVAASSVSAPVEIAGILSALGGIDIFLGIVLVILFVLYSMSEDPVGQSAWGTIIAVVGAFSLLVGGGFLVGFVLVFTAGVLAVILANLPETPSWVAPWPPRSIDPATGEVVGDLRSQRGPPPAAAAQPPPPAGGTWMATRERVVWFCLKCDFQNPTDTQVCGNCGTPRARAP